MRFSTRYIAYNPDLQLSRQFVFRAISDRVLRLNLVTDVSAWPAGALPAHHVFTHAILHEYLGHVHIRSPRI